ncbi:MAG: hypothetical protein ABSC03_05675 [Verrucomicrobiota bacterium]|jgi:outer membrane receptor for monomeric catechols
MKSSLTLESPAPGFALQRPRWFALLGVGLAIGLLASGSSLAETAKKKAKQKPAPCPASQKVTKSKSQQKYVSVTGSMIKRPADKNGQPVALESDLVVIDSQQIQRSGASSLAEVLRKSGAPH